MTCPNFEKFSAETAPIKITIRDEDGNPISLTTESFVLNVASQEEATGGADILTSTGVFTTDGTDGKVSFPMAGTESAGKYYYQIVMTNTDLTTRVIASGKFTILQQI